MKTTLRLGVPALALALLLPAAAPAEEAPVACDTDLEVIEEGWSASYDAVVTGIPSADAHAPEAFSEIVSIAPSVGETAIKATVTAVMTWDAPGDLELLAFDMDGNSLGSSTAFNPTDGNVETVTLSVDACEGIQFVVENYAGVPGTPISLEVSVEGKRPRTRG